MLTGIAKRLGFIFFVALGIRAVGGLFSPEPPKNEVEVIDYGGHRVAKAAMATSQLAAPLDDPLMQQALESLPFHGDGPGAKMTYKSSNGPVVLTPNDVAELNSRYHRLKGS